MRIQSFIPLLIAVLSLSVVASAEALPSDYTFTNILDVTASGLTGLTPPALNNHGQVEFSALDATHQFIFRAEAGNLTTIAQRVINDQSAALAGGAINDSGLVMFNRWGMDVPDTGVYVSDGTSTKLIAPLNLSPNLRGLGTISNDGTVAFTGEDAPGHVGLFASKNGQITTLVLESQFGIGDFNGMKPQINDNGEVVFRAGAADREDLYAVSASGGPVTKVVDHADLGTNGGVGGNYSVNNAGRVAFVIEQSK